MTLNFPSDPSNGDVYDNYIWVEAEEAWRRLTTPPNTRLNNLEDVNIVTPENGEVLIYNSTSDEWINNSIPDPLVSVSSLQDTSISTVSPDQLIRWNGTAWVNDTAKTNSIQDSAITDPKIATNAVVESKIANNAVTTNKISNSAVTTEKINNNAVTTTKINNDAVTRDKINANAMLGFTAQVTFAANTTWSVPALARPLVKVTIIGGGGGGGGGQGNSSTLAGAGGAGGTSTFNAGGAGTFSAGGGNGGAPPAGTGARASTAGFSAGNGGMGGQSNNDGNVRGQGLHGNGGDMIVRYVNLTGISSVGITIGPGGTAGAAGGSGQVGNAGGRGEIIVEYVAA